MTYEPTPDTVQAFADICRGAWDQTESWEDFAAVLLSHRAELLEILNLGESPTTQ